MRLFSKISLLNTLLGLICHFGISGGNYSFWNTRVKLLLGYGVKNSGDMGYPQISWDTGYLVGMVVLKEREIALHAALWDRKYSLG